MKLPLRVVRKLVTGEMGLADALDEDGGETDAAPASADRPAGASSG